jgi:hypothetical protein
LSLQYLELIRITREAEAVVLVVENLVPSTEVLEDSVEELTAVL